jgi:hypothetical protein
MAIQSWLPYILGYIVGKKWGTGEEIFMGHGDINL